MAGRFEFVSPGAAFTEQVTKVLAQQKAEERQQLLDALSMKAEQRAEAQAADEQRMHSAALASQQQQDEMARAAALGQNLDVGDDPEARGYSPENIGVMQKWGMLNQMTDPGKPAEPMEQQGDWSNQEPVMSPAVPGKTHYSYVGTDKQRELAKRREQTGKVIAQFMQDPKNKAHGQLVAQMTEANGGIVPDQAWEMMLPDDPVSMFSDKTGKLTSVGTVPHGGHVITQPYPPQMPAGLLKPTHLGNTPEGHPVFEMPNGTTRVDSSVTIGKDTGDTPLGIPQAMLDKHTNEAIPLLTPKHSFWSSAKSIDPNDMTSFRQSAYRLISAAKATESTKYLARLYVNDPAEYNKALSNPKLQLNEDEIGRLRQLTDNIAGPSLVKYLAKYPVRAASLEQTLLNNSGKK